MLRPWGVSKEANERYCTEYDPVETIAYYLLSLGLSLEQFDANDAHCH
jgi:hypothetical protein